VGAPTVWEQGVLGGGVVVASIDTGVDFEHPALVAQYRGTLDNGSFSHDGNWFDPTGICGDVPCDNVGHGTHTVGTIVGGDGPGPFTPDVGLAPGARWIAAKGCEDLDCSESALLAAGQWVLAPTDLDGSHPDPSRRPDIVNNSWGGGPDDPFYQDVVRAWRAAGIVPVFSSGAFDATCGAGGSPGDYLESVSVGATDSADVVAEFSGRGPSVFGKVNPNVVAPGVDIESSVPGGGFELYSGTSMAAAHVSGAFALIMSAAPELHRQVDAAQFALEATAVDIVDLTCGGDDDGDPNNVAGEGRIDVAAAVALVATGGTLEGVVTDARSGRALAGVRVSAADERREFSAVTEADGTFRLFLAAGRYTVSASVFGYETSVVPGVKVERDRTTVQRLALRPLPRHTVSGQVVFAEDGSPAPGAVVRAVGVPVAPVRADHDGRYRIVLPTGVYTLTARRGGCTGAGSVDVVLARDLVVDLPVTTTIDDAGHGCIPMTSPPRTARFQTDLYGDDTYGRLRLPFAFPYYGEEYRNVFVTTNGVLTFEDPGFASPVNEAIPSPEPPNAAIYALWTDLVVDLETEVAYDTDGRAPNRSFIIEFVGLRAYESEARTDLTVTLWENGAIDIWYGAFDGSPGDGSTATIGIESPDGSDGLQFSFREALLEPNTGYRYTIVPTGVVEGVVTNVNDGLPVAGATVTAEPGGRTAVTDEDGRYALRLVPGGYTLTFEAENYSPATRPLDIAADETPEVDVALRAAAAVVTPPAIAATVELGETTVAAVDVANVGSGPLVFEVRERDLGQEAPATAVVRAAPSPASQPGHSAPVRPPTWTRFRGGAAVASPTVGALFDGPLDVIIDDPDDDSPGGVEVTRVLGGADPFEVSLRVELTPGTAASEAVGYLFLDTDQDRTTGVPPDALFGLPTQEVGVDAFIDLFSISQGIAYLVDATTFEMIAELPVSTDGSAIALDVPLEALGDDGSLDVAGVLGDAFQPTDWVPDTGKGTVEPYRDAPWMSVGPVLGVVDEGDATELTVALGAPDLGPGTYRGQLLVITNDPRVAVYTVDVALTVVLPKGFGGLTGTVTNARAGFPIPATVEVAAERDGRPYPARATADDSGTFVLYGPSGTWPASVASEGYAPFSGDVTIVAGEISPFDPALDPLWPFATLEGGPLAFTVGPDGTATAPLVVGNVAGRADLTFAVGERNGAVGPPVPPVDPPVGPPAEAPDGAPPPGATIPAPVAPSATVPPPTAPPPAGTVPPPTVPPPTVPPPTTAPPEPWPGPTEPPLDGSSSVAPPDRGGEPVPPSLDGNDVLVLLDALPFGSDALFQVLGLLGTAVDVAGSAELATLDLASYRVVFVANDQPQPFYAALDDAMPSLEGYVEGGGFLWFGAAGWGWNGGEPDGLPLPGGGEVVGPEVWDVNEVTAPDHPVAAGLPSTFTGTSASHAVLRDHPEGTVIATTPEGGTTLVDYALGAGRVLALTQPVEYGWERGEDTGAILANSVLYALAFEPSVDVPWLSVAPTGGVVPAGGTTPLAVTVDAAGLAPGTYTATVVVRTDDPLVPRLYAVVTLEVTADPPSPPPADPPAPPVASLGTLAA
jgi:hypothetical protein